jgi:predicted neuraminidase
MRMHCWTIAVSLAWLWCAGRSVAAEPLPDLALQPPRIITSPGPEYDKHNRGAQGVPALERTAKGRLWAAWYTGKSTRGVESSSSYVVLATSGDDGHTWSDLKMVIQAPRFVHTYDPCLWIDPSGRLWFFWAQSAGVQDGRMGVWAIVAKDPEAEEPEWTTPRRIANGVMLNKPTVLKNGDWLLPVGLWRDNTNVPNVSFDEAELRPYTVEMLVHDLGDERGSNVYRSGDQGETFQWIGQVRVPGTRVDEHMIIERRDGSLWMLLRNTGGIAQSTSTDGGRTWSEGTLFMTGGKVASKRFFIRRLQSGALLMVRNDAPTSARSHMTAFVSDDDGATWQGGLLLDERESSYPDGVHASDGTIYIIYDHQRYTLNRDGVEGAGAVLMAVFDERDVRAGQPVTARVRLRTVVSQLRDPAGVKDESNSF